MNYSFGVHSLSRPLGTNLGSPLGIGGFLSGVPYKGDLLYNFDTRTDYTLYSDANEAYITGGVVGIVIGTGVLYFTSLSGITITSYEGTIQPTINGNNIEFQAGQYSYLLLSNGTEVFFNGHTYDSKLGTSIRSTGFYFNLVSTGQLKSTLEGLNRGYNKIGTLQVIKDNTHSTNYLHNMISSFITFPDNLIFDRSSGTYNYEQRVLAEGGVVEDLSGLLSELTDIALYNESSRENAYYDRLYIERVLAEGGIIEDEGSIITELLELEYSPVSTTPTRFHVSELDITTIDGYFNTGAKERFYQQYKVDYNNKDYIDRLIAYNTQKLWEEAIRVHKYIGNGDNLITDDDLEYIYTAEGLPTWI